MSQQTLFAICLVAGLVALASAQSMNFQDCSRSVRGQAERYRQDMMSAVQKFGNSMQSTAGSAMDMSAMQDEIDKMTQSVTSLTNMQDGFDMGRVTSVYMENLQRMANIGRQAFRPQLMMSSMSTYMDFVNSMMTTNTQFMQSVASACMPGNRQQ